MLCVAGAYAGQPTWAGGNDNKASNGSNWNNTGGLPPGQTDKVVISAGTVIFDTNLTYGALSFSGGTLNGNATLTLGTLGASDWTGGTMTFSSGGGVVVSGGGSLSISGSSTDHDFGGSAVSNSGTVNWTGGRLRSGNGGTFTNNGTFNDSASSDVNNDLGGTSLTFTNGSAGTYNKTATGTTTFYVPLNNSGAINVSSGRLTIHGGGTSSGSLTASGMGSDLVIDNGYTLNSGSTVNGAVRFTGGTVTANGTINANGLSLEGGSLHGSQTFSGGSVTWTGGDWNATETTTVAGNATINISGGNDHDFSARAVANGGTVNWSGGRLRSGNGGTFTNNGTFNDSASNDVNNDLGGTSLVFTNAAGATYNKTAAGQTNFYVPFNNSGTVNVNAGTLNLNGGGTLSSGASLNAASGANVVFSNSYTLGNASALTGAGNFTVTGGSFSATGTVSVNNFSISGGRVSGAQTFKGLLGWNGGDFNNGDSTTIDTTGTLTISGTADHDFSAHQMANNGTTNWTGGRLRSGNGGTFTNNGTFNDTASSDVNNDWGGASAVFTNASGATYNKNAAGQTSFYVPLDNSGVVNVGNGTLSLQGGGTLATGGRMNASAGTHVIFGNSYTLSDNSQLAGSGDYTVTGGTLTANGNISVSTLAITGGTFAGNHTLTGSVGWSGGSLNGAGTTTIASSSNLTISGTSDHDFSARSIVNNNTTSWTGGRLRSGNGGTFTNNGTFNDTASSDVNNDWGGTAFVFSNASGATYNKSAAGQTNFYVPFENSGAANVTTGTLNLNGGGTLHSGGTLNAGSGAGVIFSNSYTLADASALTGAGNFTVTGGTFTATGNVTVNNFAITGGHVAGQQTFKGTLAWNGGDFNNGDATTIGAAGSLTISGAGDHDFSAHQFTNSGTTNWTGGRLRSGNAGTFTNNGTFVDSASSEINNDWGGSAFVFTNGNGGTYRKTGAGQTSVFVPFVNSGTLDLQTGTLALYSTSTLNAGTTTTGSGLLKLMSGVLTADGAMTFSDFEIAGGTVSGNAHTFNGAIKWSAGNFNSSGTTSIGGTLTIDSGADHDFNGHTFNNNGTVNWTASSGRMRTGNGGQFQNNGTFNDSASNVWNNDYQNAAGQFFNGSTGSYNKTSAGTSTFDGVSFVNAGTINVQGGSLDLQGGGSSPVGAHFNASSGASLRFTGGTYAVADGSGFAGKGSFVIAGGKVSIGTTVSASDFQLIGGTLAGSQTFAGGLTWSDGNMNDANSTTTIGNGGTLTITSNADHDMNAHGLVNNGTVTWNGGRIRSGNGGTIVNNGTFNDSSGASVNNDYQNATLTFTNGAGGTYSKSGNNTSIYYVPFTNNGTIEVSAGALNLNAGGAIGNGAAFRGTGQALLTGGTFATSGTIDSTSLVIDGAQISGTHTFTGSVQWNTGNFNASGNTTIGSGATLHITSGADHDFSGHGFVNNGTIDWATGAGRLRAGNGATFVNNGIFNDSASSSVNNDYQNATLTFTNGNGASYNKLSTGNTDYYIPFNNAGNVTVSAGALLLHSGGRLSAGAAFLGSGDTQLTGGTFSVAGGLLSTHLVLNGATLAGTPELHGTFTFASGFLGSGSTTTIASDGFMTLSTSADHDLPGHAIVNNGVINWDGGRIRGGNGSTITNNGIFNDNASSAVNNDYQNAALTFTNSATGLYKKSGTGTTTFSVPFVNDGTVAVTRGTVIFSGSFTNRGSIGLANGATAQFANPLTFANSTLSGTGTINASAVTAGALVSPGNSPGMLAITGDMTLLSTSVLLIELGGTNQGTDYDYLNIGGNLSLGGTLNLKLVNGFETWILPSNTFTIASASGTVGLTGTFANVANGQRLSTIDGLGSFQVNYGNGLNGVTLSNFQAIPEPSTYALLGLGLATLLVAARRRKR